MGDHFLPRYYLRGFAEEPETNIIYRYQKGTNELLKTNVKNVAQENKLYSRALEKFLAREIEKPGNPVLKKIRIHQNISIAEKKVLSRYIVVMMLRVPQTKIQMTTWFEKNKEVYFDGFEAQLRRLIDANPDKADIAAKRIQELREVRDQGRIKPEEIWHSMVTPERLPKVSLAIENMTWTFLIAKKTSGFLTGDNPVFFSKEIGLANRSAELTFPISTDVALLAFWGKDITCRFEIAKESAVQEINRRTVNFATKYIFYYHPAQWVINLLTKRNLRIRKLANRPLTTKGQSIPALLI